MEPGCTYEPSYKRLEGQYSLQGYLYKTETLVSVCPNCNQDLSGIPNNEFYCFGCGKKIDRHDKPRKISIEFFELNGEWLTHDIDIE